MLFTNENPFFGGGTSTMHHQGHFRIKNRKAVEEITSFITLFLQNFTTLFLNCLICFFHLSNNLLRDALSSAVHGSLQQNRDLFAHDGPNISTYGAHHYAGESQNKNYAREQACGCCEHAM